MARTRAEVEEELRVTRQGIATKLAGLNDDPNPNRAVALGDDLHELTQIRVRLEGELQGMPEE